MQRRERGSSDIGHDCEFSELARVAVAAWGSATAGARRAGGRRTVLFLGRMVALLRKRDDTTYNIYTLREDGEATVVTIATEAELRTLRSWSNMLGGAKFTPIE